MPTDIIAAVAPGSPWFDIPDLVGPIEDRRPIPEDLNHAITVEPLSCDRAHYLAPPLSTPHPTRAGYYFVGDEEHRTEEIGDVYTWSRQWANIPRAYSRPLGTYAYRFPGLDSGSVGSVQTITAMSPSGSADAYVAAPEFTIAGHGYSAGQRVFLRLTYSGAVRGTVATILSTTTNTFVTTGIYIGTGIGTFTTGTANTYAPWREAKTMPADAVENFSYALPGVTAGIAVPADFRPLPLFAPIVLLTGQETEVLSSATVPTLAEYRALAAAGAYLVAESAVGVYRGGILVRRDVLVRYTV